MKPYYADADVTLYHGDCRDILPHLDAGSVDLLLVDPPYGGEWKGRERTLLAGFDVLTGDDGSLPIVAVLAPALRALRRGRHVYCFGARDFATLPIGATSELIWDKGIVGLGDLSLPWGPQHERILFGVYDHSKSNRDNGMGRLTARLRRGSVLRSQRAHSGAVNRHPTEKPVDILRQMIESSTLLGETVLDPCAGSGSTLVAARLEGRTAIGVEIEERYCEVAADRLRQQQLPLAV
jgi:DNA modification methylase